MRDFNVDSKMISRPVNDRDLCSRSSFCLLSVKDVEVQVHAYWTFSSSTHKVQYSKPSKVLHDHSEPSVSAWPIPVTCVYILHACIYKSKSVDDIMIQIFIWNHASK